MNLKKLFIFPLLLVVLNALGQEANLTVKPVAKKKYSINLNSLTDVVQSMAGMEMKVKVKCTANGVMEIVDVAPNGDFTVLSTWNDLEAFTSAMGKDSTFHVKNMNVTVKTLCDKSGKIIKTGRTDTSGPADLAHTMIGQLAGNLKLPVLPAKTVNKGESWKSQSTDTIQPLEFPMTMIIGSEDEYSFAGTVTESGTEYYRVTKASPVKISGEGEQSGMNILVDGTGMSEGFLLLDKTTLLPAKIEEKTGMDLSLMVSGMQSMAIPMTQNVESKITFTEIRDSK